MNKKILYMAVAAGSLLASGCDSYEDRFEAEYASVVRLDRFNEQSLGIGASDTEVYYKIDLKRGGHDISGSTSATVRRMTEDEWNNYCSIYAIKHYKLLPADCYTFLQSDMADGATVNFGSNQSADSVKVVMHADKVKNFKATIQDEENPVMCLPLTLETSMGSVLAEQRNLILVITEKRIRYMVTTVVGSKDVSTGEDGYGINATVGNPCGVNLAPDGSLWFTDRKNHKIRSLSTATQMVSTMASEASGDVWQGAFNSKGVYYYVNRTKNNVNRVNADGSTTVVLDGLNGPMGIVFDKNDKMYVTEREGFRITMLTADGVRSEMTVGAKGKGPIHLEFDKDDRMIVARQASYTIEVLHADGTFTTIAGTGKRGTVTDGEPGNPLTAVVGSAFGFTFGSDGCLYFADSTYHLLRRIVPDENGDLSKGTVETLAGMGGKADAIDGEGLNAAFNYPYDVELTDDCKTMYIADMSNHMIRQISVVEK